MFNVYLIMKDLLVIVSKEIDLSSSHHFLSNTHITVFNWVLTKTWNTAWGENTRNHLKLPTAFKNAAETSQYKTSRNDICPVLPIRPNLAKFQQKLTLLKLNDGDNFIGGFGIWKFWFFVTGYTQFGSKK